MFKTVLRFSENPFNTGKNKIYKNRKKVEKMVEKSS